MAQLITDIAVRLLISLLLVAFAVFLFADILTIGENHFQSFIVISFYCYCFISLFIHSRYKLFHILALPIFTQFIHIFQKYAFTTGSNSIWRLLPFIILDAYFAFFLIKKETALSIDHKTLILFWIILNTFFLFISPNLEKIILGGIILYLLIIPLFFVYLNVAVRAVDFWQETEKYLCLVFLILGIGTVGLVFAGAGYKGSDNLLATRNIADMNVTMAYFILLWPFVILYTSRNMWSFPGKAAVVILFLTIVILSFSRGAILLVIPYILITLALSKSFINIKWTFPLVILAFLYSDSFLHFLEQQDLFYFWHLRFADVGSVSTLLSKLESLSGRDEIHNIAYKLFLKSPIIGNGIGSFEFLGPGYREAHSLWFTLLAEQGIIGTVFMYGIFLGLFICLTNLLLETERKLSVLLTSLIFFLLFNHTVGSTFVILPGNSITINCIAPILLICLYFYSVSLRSESSVNKLNEPGD